MNRWTSLFAAILVVSFAGQASSQKCFNISRIEVLGVGVVDPAQVEKIANFKTGCITLEDIEEARKRILKFYFDAGYIAARVYIPRQNVADGVFDIQLIEGQITQVVVDVNGEQRPSKALTAFPGVVGAPANLRTIEQGIDQIDRLRTQSAKSELRPGDEPGDTVLYINTTATRPWQLGFSVDNRGSGTTGENTVNLSFSYEDLVGLNDQWIFDFRRSSDAFPLKFSNENPDSRSLLIGGSIPYGRWTLSTYGSYSDYNVDVRGATSTIETSGNSKSIQASADYLFHRDSDSKTSLNFGLTWKDNENFVLGTQIDVSSRALTFFDLGVSHVQYTANGVFDGSIKFRQGLSLFGAFDDDDAPPGSPKGQFSSVLLSAGYQTGWTFPQSTLLLSSRIDAQFADDLLFGSEQFSLGSFSGIRGTRQGVLFGNNGVQVRNTLTWLQRLDGWDVTLRPYVGLDGGRIFGQDRFDIDGDSLISGTAGLGIEYRNVAVDVEYSQVLHRPSSESGADALLTAKFGLKF